MALIHVFDGINKKTSYTFNGKIKDNLRGINWDNAIILRGGFKVDENYETQPDDIIFIRKTPAADPVFWTFVGVTALVAGGTILGDKLYKQQAELEKYNRISKASGENTEKLASINGTRNQIATGRNIPFAIGQSLFTPYYLCSPHYTIEGAKGEKQYFNAVLEIAYNNILINKIKMGETVIKNFNGAQPQNGVYTWDNGVYYDENNIIEIRQTGAFENDAFNNKIVSVELNKEIPHEHLPSNATAAEKDRINTEWRAGVVQELPNNAKSVELITLFDGLRRMNDEGQWEPATIILLPQWTNVNNPSESDWRHFDNGFIQNGIYSAVFSYNENKQMRFIARQNFTAEQTKNKTIKIRVVRATPKAEKGAKDTVYLTHVQTTIYDPKKSNGNTLYNTDVLEASDRDKCCRIGVRIAANANTKGLLDAIRVIETGCARIWDGTAWTTNKVPTRNLAAWVLELMTNDHHKPSKYSDNEIDLESFGAWYEYCEQQGFNADGVITKAAKKKTTIDTLLRNGNAALVYNVFTGKKEIAIDNGRNYSVALLNSENIISISTQKQFKRKTDGRKVTYINGVAGYEIDTVKFMRDGGDYDPANDTLQELPAEYITDYAHAFKYAWRNMAEEMAQPRTVTVKAGLESAYYPLYSRVELQHKILKKGLAHGVINAAVWRNGLLKEIHLDGAVEFPQDVACGLIINCVSDNGRGLLAIKVHGTGKTNILYVDTEVSSSAAVIPTAGNLCSFGELDIDGEFTQITTSMKIINAEENDNAYTLTLVDYNADIYNYGTMPEYKSNITTVPNGQLQTIEEQREYTTPADVIAEATGAAQAAADMVTKGARFTNIYKIRPVEMSLEDIIAKMDDDARNASASISMSADEILLQVQSLDEQQRAFIAITKDQILAQVDDMAQELTGLINVQAGAVSAIVEGGGAAGQLSLSLNLPVTITAATRAQLVAASTEEKVAAVYAPVENTDYYGIKGNASESAVKALWDDAVAADLLASQIELQADQIYIDGDVIVNNQNKIKAALIDVENMFAQEITLKGGGVIKDINNNFTISSNGEIIAKKGRFSGGLGEEIAINKNDYYIETNGTSFNILQEATQNAGSDVSYETIAVFTAEPYTVYQGGRRFLYINYTIIYIKSGYTINKVTTIDPFTQFSTEHLKLAGSSVQSDKGYYNTSLGL